jgi:hypothetical protein
MIRIASEWRLDAFISGPVDPSASFHTFGSNRHNHNESYPFKVCLWKWSSPGLESWQGAGPAAPAGLAAPAWCGSVTPFYPKCVPASKNTNTTRGTLLVLKTCMKLVICLPRFRDFNGQELVVRIVNTKLIWCLVVG